MKNLLAVLLVCLVCSCGEKERNADRPRMTAQTPIDTVLSRNAPSLMEIPGVVGVYRAETEEKKPCITIMVEKKTTELEARLPKSLDGYPVLIEETGKIRPLQ